MGRELEGASVRWREWAHGRVGGEIVLTLMPNFEGGIWGDENFIDFPSSINEKRPERFSEKHGISWMQSAGSFKELSRDLNPAIMISSWMRQLSEEEKFEYFVS